MSRQFKKYFSIFSALLLGGVIIVAATNAGGLLGVNVSTTQLDSKDGSWLSDLSVVPRAPASTRVEKGKAVLPADSNMWNATTTTDLISRKLVLEYLSIQNKTGTSTLSETQTNTIAESLAQEVKLPRGTHYKLSDLNITQDNGEASIAAYIKTFSSLLSDFAVANSKENALTVVEKALAAKDPSVLKKLPLYIAQYQTLENNLVAMKTPSSIATPHLHLVQSYDDLRVATMGFQSIFSDPVVGFAAFSAYQRGLTTLSAVGEEYKKVTSTLK